LLRKGIFPYDWLDSFEKLSEKQLPEMSEFYSKLNGCDITDEDYQHVRKVWKHFDVKSFREYHDLYMKLDVLLLTDVFENFRDVSMKNYECVREFCVFENFRDVSMKNYI